MRALEQLLQNQPVPFNAKKLIEFFNSSSFCNGEKCPEYHIHLVLGALEKAGVLSKDSKGSYELVGNFLDTNAWMDAIEKLKRREDLYKIAE